MLEMLLTSSALILLLTLLRVILKTRFSPRLRYTLWLLVALRLLIPGSLFTLPFSLPSLMEESGLTDTVEEVRYTTEYNSTIGSAPYGYDEQGIQSLEDADWFRDAEWFDYPDITDVHIVDSAPITSEEATGVPNSGEGYFRLDLEIVRDRFFALRVIWYAGMVVMALWFLAANLRFRRKLKHTALPADVDAPLPVKVAPDLISPCLCGELRPTIYVTPACVADETRLRHVIAHEYAHYRQGDHVWSLVRCLCLVVWWFNPLVWVAAALSRRDCELACDAAAIRRLGEEQRIPYGRTLVDMVASTQSPTALLHTATTMTGGKKSIAERVALIARRPKMTLLTLLAVVLLTAFAAACAFGGADTGEDDAAKELAAQIGDTVQLFSVQEGEESFVLLSWDGVEAQFDWPHITPRGCQMEGALLDIDGDGADELAVSVVSGTGTGVSVQDLYIVEMADDRTSLSEHRLPEEQLALLTEMLTCAADGTDITFSIEDQTLTVSAEGTVDTFPHLGEYVSFAFSKNGIRMTVGIPVRYTGSAIDFFLAELSANVLFSNGQFGLSDYRLSPAVTGTQPSSDAELSGGIRQVESSVEITFPLSTDKKNEYNAHIYETTPFVVSFRLPEGWSVVDDTVLHQNGAEVFPSVDGIFCTVYLLNEKGDAVGSLGYNLAPAVDAGNRDPMALFAGITLAQHYFDCHDAFTPIRESESQLVAITDVITHTSANDREENPVSVNKGILLRDEALSVYIAIELQADALTDKQVQEIADSLSLNAAVKPGGDPPAVTDEPEAEVSAAKFDTVWEFPRGNSDNNIKNYAFPIDIDFPYDHYDAVIEGGTLINTNKDGVGTGFSGSYVEGGYSTLYWSPYFPAVTHGHPGDAPELCQVTVHIYGEGDELLLTVNLTLQQTEEDDERKVYAIHAALEQAEGYSCTENPENGGLLLASDYQSGTDTPALSVTAREYLERVTEEELLAFVAPAAWPGKEFSSPAELTSYDLFTIAAFSADYAAWYDGASGTHLIPVTDLTTILDGLFEDYHFDPADTGWGRYNAATGIHTTYFMDLTLPAYTLRETYVLDEATFRVVLDDGYTGGVTVGVRMTEEGPRIVECRYNGTAQGIAQAAWDYITGSDFFYMDVYTETDETRILLNDGNTWNLPSDLSGYEWAHTTSQGSGTAMTVRLSSPDGKAELRCFYGSDRVRVLIDGKEYYFTADDRYDEDVDALFRSTLNAAGDALVYNAHNSIVIDGRVSDYSKVVEEYARRYAANLNTLPDWVPEKPNSTVYNNASVSQAYFGEGTENFCGGFSLYLSPEMGMSPYWQAGSGMTEETRGEYAGWWLWGMGAHFTRNADGDWYCTGHYTGGESLIFPTKLENATPEELVYYFYHTTPGHAHNYLIPYYICRHPVTTVEELYPLLAQQEDPTALMSVLYQFIAQYGIYSDVNFTLTELGKLDSFTITDGYVQIPEDTLAVNVVSKNGVSIELTQNGVQVGSLQSFVAPQHFPSIEQGQLEFENGQLSRFWSVADHFSYTDHRFIEGCSAPAVIAHSLYAPPYEDESAGSTSWVICFAEESGYLHYRMTLNADYFTREEAMELARSVTFGYNAFLIPNYTGGR